MNQRPTEEDKAKVRAWYEENGMDYLEHDWFVRFENGESAGYQHQASERLGDKYVQAFDPRKFLELEEAGAVAFFWPEREDRAAMEALDEFFAPYLVRLTPGQYEVVHEYMFERRLQEDIAADTGRSQQAVSKHIRAAVDALVREVSRDWPDPEGTDLQRFQAVLNEFWRKRFDVDFAGLTPA